MIRLDFTNDVWSSEELRGIGDYKLRDVKKDGILVRDRLNELTAIWKLNSQVAAKGGLDVLKDQRIEPFIKEKKYIHKVKDLWMVDSLGEIWSESFSLYRDILEISDWKLCEKVLISLGIGSFKSHVALLDSLKQLSDVAKFMGEVFSNKWYLFVDLGMMWKYGSDFNLEDLKMDVKDWFAAKRMKARGSNDYYRLFSKNIKRFFDIFLVEKSNWKPMSWHDWLWSGNWGTNGATDGKVITGMYRGKRVILDKNKNSTVLASNYVELEKVLYDNSWAQVNKVSIKPDEAPNKTRLIVSSDNKTYLLMSYISHWLERNIDGAISTLYQSSGQMLDFWLKFGWYVENEVGVKLPLDQSKFDHHATAEMIWIVLAEMWKRSPKDYDYRKAITRVTEAIFDERAKVVWHAMVEGEKVDMEVKWLGGVPSGWRWTAFIDTIINFGEFWTVIDIAVEMGMNMDVLNMVCQGDDDNVVARDMRVASTIVYLYSAVGLEINEKKFFVSTTRDEFLRRFAQKGLGIRGYLARGIHSILWRSPNKVDDETGLLNEILENWLTCMRRGASKNRVMKWMLADMAGASKVSKKDIKDWLTTPNSVGGAGILEMPFGSRWVKISENREREVWEAKGAYGLRQLAENNGMQLNDLEVDAICNSLVKGRTKSKRLVTKAELDRKPKMPSPTQNYVLVSLGAIWIEKFPKILRSKLVSDCFKGMVSWSAVKDKLEEKSWVDFDRLKSQSSRKVFSTWLLEGFSFKVGKSMEWLTDIVKASVMTRGEIMLKRALGMRKVTMRTIDLVCLEMEWWLKTGVWKDKIWLGCGGTRFSKWRISN